MENLLSDYQRNSQNTPVKGSVTPGAFVGKSNKLYIRIRRLQPEGTDWFHQRVAVYPSIESYNKRSARPDYKDLSEVIGDYLSEVIIDLQTLTIADADATPKDSSSNESLGA